MKKYTEDELYRIAHHVYDEIKNEAGKDVEESDPGLVIADVSLNVIIKFLLKMQEDMES